MSPDRSTSFWTPQYRYGASWRIYLSLGRSAYRGLQAHKLRTSLAMLGIIIGTAAVISMLSTGSGVQEQILSKISAMGVNLIRIRPAQANVRGVHSGEHMTLTFEDAQSILQDVPNVVAVAPQVSGGAQVKYRNKNRYVGIIGSVPSYFELRNFKIEYGRSFTDIEADQMVRVAVIGPVTADHLFGDLEPVGKNIKINNISFRVVGVTKRRGEYDDQIVIPCLVAMRQLFVQVNRDALREILVQVDHLSHLEQVQADVTARLRLSHRIWPDRPNDFEMNSDLDVLEMTLSLIGGFRVLLGAVGFTLLGVGGIGIMNIMLVMVQERTKEIGVRKAIGAKNRDILLQFLGESVMLSGTGGLLGISVGLAAASLIGMFTEFSAPVHPTFVFIAVGFSGIVGVSFGFYPAWRAALLDPIEALRYE